MSRPAIRWLARPEDHDYPAAAAYLTLLFPETRVRRLIGSLRKTPVVEFKAKDIFRASRLPLLGTNNGHVQRDRKKIRTGKKLSPILLVRDPAGSRLIIADGYHRLCAVYSFDEDAVIPCQIT